MREKNIIGINKMKKKKKDLLKYKERDDDKLLKSKEMNRRESSHGFFSM